MHCRESHQMGPPTIAGGLAVVSCILTTCSWSVFNRSRRGLSNPKYGLQTPRFHVSRHTETDIKTKLLFTLRCNRCTPHSPCALFNFLCFCIARYPCGLGLNILGDIPRERWNPTNHEALPKKRVVLWHLNSTAIRNAVFWFQA